MIIFSYQHMIQLIYFKSNLSFYRDQNKLCTKLIITEIFIILIFLSNNTVAFPLLKTVFCASQYYFKLNFITKLFNNHIKCKCFNNPNDKIELSTSIKNKAQLLASYKKCTLNIKT